VALRPRARRTLAAHRRSEVVAAYLFLAPGFILFAAAILYPIARAFQISLHEWAIVPGIASEYVGLDNYRRAFDDPIFWKALENTGFYMAATVPAQIALGLTAAILLDARMPARGLFRVVYYLPVVTSWVVVSLLFRYLFLTDGGLVNWTLTDGAHLADENVSWLGDRWTALTAISILGIWKGVGWSMVIFLAALQGIPRELEEAAAIDGASRFQRFHRIVLPLIAPAMTINLTLSTIGGLKLFDQVFAITNGGPGYSTETLSTLIYKQAFVFGAYGYSTAVALVLTLLVAGLALLQVRYLQSREVTY
jgi:multiple sugar transport system permease protein